MGVLVRNQRLRRDAQCKSSKGESVLLKQGDYVRFVGKHNLPKGHPFLEEGYDERFMVCCFSAYGMVLVYRDYLDGL